RRPKLSLPRGSRGGPSIRVDPMKLSTRLTLAMVALVLFTTAATGILGYRNLLSVALPRSLERLGGHVQLLATELEAVVRGARADVLAFAVDAMVEGSSGEIADRSSVFAAAERRRLASRFSAELTAKPWYDELRIIADDQREIVRADRSGPGGAIRSVPEAELQGAGIGNIFKRRSDLPPATFTSRRLISRGRRASSPLRAFRPCGSPPRYLPPMVGGLESSSPIWI